MSDREIDQTEEDIVTGVDVVEGVLTFRRHDGSEVTYSLPESLPTVDPAVDAAVWNDEGVVKVSGVTLLSGLPTSDPMVVGALWNDNSIIKLSAQT